MSPLLEIRDLRAGFIGPLGYAEAVRGVSLKLDKGKVLGIVGESGSGKSVMMMALLQLLPSGSRTSGQALFKGRDLLSLSEAEIRHVRGKQIGCIFQDPLSAFNPVVTIGNQIVEALRLHDRSVSKRAALEEAAHLLDLVAIPQATRRLHQYPHEFSGGMRQRAMIAMALANRPELLIADEPTTALDVTVQAQILELLQQLGADLGIGLVLVTHDLGVVSGMADEIAVMYGGRIVEQGDPEGIFYGTNHPYSRGLIGAIPSVNHRGPLTQIDGTPPSIWVREKGCSFHPRCPMASDICRKEDPELRASGVTLSACHHSDDVAVHGLAGTQ